MGVMETRLNTPSAMEKFNALSPDARWDYLRWEQMERLCEGVEALRGAVLAAVVMLTAGLLTLTAVVMAELVGKL